MMDGAIPANKYSSQSAAYGTFETSHDVRSLAAAGVYGTSMLYS
jgi:hypothetical protein